MLNQHLELTAKQNHAVMCLFSFCEKRQMDFPLPRPPSPHSPLLLLLVFMLVYISLPYVSHQATEYKLIENIRFHSLQAGILLCRHIRNCVP